MRDVLRHDCGDEERGLLRMNNKLAGWQPPRRRQIRGETTALHLSQEAAQRCKEEGRESGRLLRLSQEVSHITAARLHGLHDA